MKPYYDDGRGIQIYHGDCREVLPRVSVDAIVTDPPYGVGAATWDTRTPHEVLWQFLTATNGPVVWFGAAPQLTVDVPAFVPRPSRVLIWAPRFTLSHTIKSGLAYRWQPIYTWNLPDAHDGPKWDLLTDSTECGNWWRHSSTKPVELMRSLVGFAGVGDVVLDPFMGSGTTLRAAKDLGRRAIGIEISEEYCAIAAKRLSQEVMALDAAG